MASNVRSLPTSAREVVPAQVGRYNTRTFGGIQPTQLLNILRNAERGMMLDEWSDLCEWIAEDDRVASVLDTRIDSVSNVAFQCLPGRALPGQEALAQQAAEMCQEMLESTDRLTQLFDDLLGAYALGYSALEHSWVRGAGLWVSNPSPVRSRDIAFTEDWGFKFRTYAHGAVDEWIRASDHPNKFVTFALRKRGSTPLRAGAIRQVAMLWLFKRWAWKAWVNGAERLGTPLALGKVTREATQAARDALREGLENLSEGQAAVLESETGIEFPNTGFNMSADIFEKLIDKLDKAITLAILGSMDAVDGGANGSLARAEVQNAATIEPRTFKLAYQLYEVVERDWLSPFLFFNSDKFGGVVPPTPRLSIREDQSDIDVEKFAAFSAFATSGIVSANEIRQAIGLEPVAGADTLITASPPQQQTEFAFDGRSSVEAPAALPLAQARTPKPASRMTRKRISETSNDVATAIERALGFSSAGRRGSSPKRR